jgi:hypothetical protein
MSTFDLFDVWQAMKHAIANQLKELKHLQASQQLRIPLDVSGVLFEAVRSWVSWQALRKVQDQRQLLQKPPRATCSQTFTASQQGVLPTNSSNRLANLVDQSALSTNQSQNPVWANQPIQAWVRLPGLTTHPISQAILAGATGQPILE